MSYWTGTQWVSEPPEADGTSSRSRRFLGATLEATLVVLLTFGLIAGTTFAAKGGKGNVATVTAAACTVDENLVTGTGLPIGELLNFMVTDSSGTWGWVLGFTDTGEWSVNVPAKSGTATYQFAGRTYGNAGTKYTVYASCSG